MNVEFTSAPSNLTHIVFRNHVTLFGDDLIRRLESIGIIQVHQLESKSRPAAVSTSCVMINELGAPSGQNHMKGSFLTPVACIINLNNSSWRLSTVKSTGQAGNCRSFQSRK